MKKLFINLLISFSSLLLGWGLIEIIFTLNITQLPLKYHSYLSQEQQVLAQSSKKGIVPKNYILIVGDSYAQGLGDWVHGQTETQNGPYYSGHIINNRLNTDVITTGQGGLGNLTGFYLKPNSDFKFFENSLFFQTSAPNHILFYFYEGNDLNNNLQELEFLNKELPELDALKKSGDQTWIFSDNLLAYSNFAKSFPFTYFIFSILEKDHGISIFKKANANEGVINLEYTTNKALIANKQIPIPDKLQSPAIELNEEEINKSLIGLRVSIEALSERFPNSKKSLVYLPSPLSIYKLISKEVKVEIYTKGRSDFYLSSLIRPRHQLIKSKVKKITKDLGINFIDTSTSLQNHALSTVLHGPGDWFHLNQKGQEIISEVIINEIME